MPRWLPRQYATRLTDWELQNKEYMIGQISDWDVSVLVWIAEHLRTAFLTPIMKFITYTGNAGIIWIILSIVLICIPKYRKAGLASAIALIIDLLCVNICVKPLAHRIRPYVYSHEVSLIIKKAADYSFPSGHTAASFASVTALYLAGEKKLWKPALILSCLIAVSRLYLYVHYPTDVLGGMFFGILAGYVGYRLVKFLEAKLSGRKNAGKQKQARR